MLLGLLANPAARADNRLFSYVYEPGYSAQGEREFEQHVTARIGKLDGNYVAWDFREEVEFGLTDRLKTALYVNFSRVDSSGVSDVPNTHATTFESLSSEWIYRVLDPLEHSVGLSLYGELTALGDETEIEEKLILGQYWGPWATALNVGFEQAWEDSPEGGTEKEGVLDLTGGIARYLNRRWSVGIEGRNKRHFPDYGSEENSGWFAGPNVHYRGAGWGATMTVLMQVYGSGDGAQDHLQLEEYERTEVRLLVSKEF